MTGRGDPARDMEAARAIADQLELLVDRAHWPFPTYRDLLFYV